MPRRWQAGLTSSASISRMPCLPMPRQKPARWPSPSVRRTRAGARGADQFDPLGRGLARLVAIIEARPDGGVIFLPKVASADEVRMVDELLAEAASTCPSPS